MVADQELFQSVAVFILTKGVMSGLHESKEGALFRLTPYHFHVRVCSGAVVVVCAAYSVILSQEGEML